MSEPPPPPIKSQRYLHRLLCLFCAILLIGTLSSADRGQHILLGLLSAVALVFNHTLAFFYLIETANNIRKAISERDLSTEYKARHTRYKRPVYPIAFWSMVAIAATAIVGGGADAGALPGWLHQALAYLAIGMTLVAWMVEDRALGQVRVLINELNADIHAKVVAAEAARQAEGQGAGPSDRPVAAESEPERDPDDVSSQEILWMLGRWLMFLGASLWVLYAYQLMVLQAEPRLLTYAISSPAMFLLGFALERRFRFAVTHPEEAAALAAEQEQAEA